MKFVWDEKKNQILKQQKGRNGIGFEDVITAIKENRMISFEKSKKPGYEHQYLIIVEIAGYAYECPCVPDKQGIKLITVYPSRFRTKLYNLK